MQTQVSSAATGERRHHIDWLRIGAVFLLIPFHTARIFDIWEDNYVKNAQTSDALSYMIAVIAPWHMPLLFVLAGAASWFALGRRTGGQYLAERAKRLLVPFLFGLLVIVPPQVYLAELKRPGYPDSFLQFYPSFFDLPGSDLTGYNGGFTPGHLWFILYLAVFSAVALPAFLYLRTLSGSRVVSRLAGLMQYRGAIFLLAVPIAFLAALPGVSGKNPFTYMGLFMCGYLLLSDAGFQQAIARERLMALVGGVLAMGITLPLMAWYNNPTTERTPLFILFHFLVYFNMWFWIVALLGYAQKYLAFSNKLLGYASEAAYPFYILHQTIIILIGYYVVQWNIGVGPKFLIIGVTAFLGTVLVYELFVRRTNLTRLLFGMKPLPKETVTRVMQQPA